MAQASGLELVRPERRGGGGSVCEISDRRVGGGDCDLSKTATARGEATPPENPQAPALFDRVTPGLLSWRRGVKLYLCGAICAPTVLLTPSTESRDTTSSIT